jgi:hypothetical protein
VADPPSGEPPKHVVAVARLARAVPATIILMIFVVLFIFLGRLFYVFWQLKLNHHIGDYFTALPLHDKTVQ